MKKSKLKQIIKEEISKVLNEGLRGQSIEGLSHHIHDYLTKHHPNFQKLEMPYWNAGGETINQFTKNTDDQQLKDLVSQWWDLYSQKYSGMPKYAFKGEEGNGEGSLDHMFKGTTPDDIDF